VVYIEGQGHEATVQAVTVALASLDMSRSLDVYPIRFVLASYDLS
jgi:hypothetical protein